MIINIKKITFQQNLNKNKNLKRKMKWIMFN